MKITSCVVQALFWHVCYVALRNSINKRVILGPRSAVATKGIGATGGHFDSTNGFRDFVFGRETTRMVLRTGLMKFERQFGSTLRTAQT